MKRRSVIKGLAGSVVIAAVLFSTNANAVPSFARQTGLPCQACHTVFPELTTFGREFKLNGYTLTGLRQIESTGAAAGGGGGVKINEIPPLSAMLQVGFTNVASTAALRRTAGQDIQNNNVEFPQQLSFFFAGEISPHMGTFLRFTYSQPNDKFRWDSTDVRYANHTTLFGGDTIYGVTLNNNPTVQDVWNTVPAWGFPFASSNTAGTPTYSALLDGRLAQDVAGLGAYTLVNGHLYVEADAYRSAHLGVPGGTGCDPSISSCSPGTIQNFAPYWRLAWQQNFGANYLEVGTLGLYARLVPAANFPAVNGVSDKYTDVGVDAQYERPVNDSDSISAHMLYLYENVDGYSGAVGGLVNGESAQGRTLRLNGTYHLGHWATGTVAYFQKTGNSALITGDSRGYILQASYLPWENTKFTAQYTGYTKFNGDSAHA
ncbi:MAG: hypothetical protein ACYC18_11560, partial [Gammaproteobacteria bacterium]